MASNEIKNTIELNKLLEDVVTRLLENVSKEILEKFKTDYVQKYAYANPRVRYNNPAGQEFKEAWEWEDIKKSAFGLSTKMFYNWATMTEGKRNGTLIHSSASSKWPTDTREALSEYLDTGVPSNPFMKTLYGARSGGYWGKFISGYVESGKMDVLIRKHARNLGLSVS